MKNIKKLLCIVNLLLCGIIPLLNGMEEQRPVKLFYKDKLLTWRQATAFLEAKIFKDMLDDEDIYNKGEQIDEIIELFEKKDYFKNNILDIINIFPKKAYKDLGAWNDDYKIMLHNEIQKIMNREEGKESEKIMGLIKCAHYIDSPVIDDLIKFALQYELVDQKILDSVDYTPESLEYVKRCYSVLWKGFLPNIYHCESDFLKKTIPLENVEYWIDKNSKNFEDNNIINAIKSKYYKKNEERDTHWLRKNREIIKKGHVNISKNNNFLYCIDHFSHVSLENKLRLLSDVHNELNLTNEQLERFDAYVKFDKYRTLKMFLLMIPGFFLDIVLPILVKKYSSYSWGQIFSTYGIKKVIEFYIGGIMMEISRYGRGLSVRERDFIHAIVGYMWSLFVPFIVFPQTVETCVSIPSTYRDVSGNSSDEFKSTIKKDNKFDKQKFMVKKNTLQQIEKSLLEKLVLIKNEYVIKK